MKISVNVMVYHLLSKRRKFLNRHFIPYDFQEFKI